MAEVLDADFLVSQQGPDPAAIVLASSSYSLPRGPLQVAYAYPGVPPGEGVPTEPGEERWLIVYQSGPMFSSSRQGTTQLAALPLVSCGTCAGT